MNFYNAYLMPNLPGRSWLHLKLNSPNSRRLWHSSNRGVACLIEAFQEEGRAPDTRRIVLDHAVDLLEAKALFLIWEGQKAMQCWLRCKNCISSLPNSRAATRLCRAFMQLSTERTLLRTTRVASCRGATLGAGTQDLPYRAW